MPSRRSDAIGRRAVIAVAVPTAVAGLAGTVVMATPAHAASPSPTLPFATSICGTSSPSAKASPSPSAKSHSPSATPKPSPSTSTTPKNDPAQSPSASPSASASTGAPNAAGTATTPAPSTSTSSSGGGFWGWVNGVWTWIFGSAPVTHSSAPAVQAAASHAGGTGSSVTKVVPAIVSKAAAPVKKAVAPSTTAPAADPSSSCVPSSAVKRNAATSNGDVAAEIPWHLSTPSMTMYNLTYNGITTVKTADGSMQALDFTAQKVTLVSMVTFSHQGGTKLQYVDGGQNETVTLENVHLLTTSMTADVLGLLHLTFTPTSTPTQLLGLLQGVTVPIPLLFTNVEADNAFLNTGSIVIPGFNGHSN